MKGRINRVVLLVALKVTETDNLTESSQVTLKLSEVFSVLKSRGDEGKERMRDCKGSERKGARIESPGSSSFKG